METVNVSRFAFAKYGDSDLDYEYLRSPAGQDTFLVVETRNGTWLVKGIAIHKIQKPFKFSNAALDNHGGREWKVGGNDFFQVWGNNYFTTTWSESNNYTYTIMGTDRAPRRG